MGICDSLKKSKAKTITQEQQFSNNYINNINNINNNSSGILPSNAIYKNKDDTFPDYYSQDKNDEKCPELIHYEQTTKNAELSKTQSKRISRLSSLKEQEVIIKGEVNQNVINKEEDFDNDDFKNLVKNNGGIVIQEDENINNNNTITNESLLQSFNLGKESISEIKSLKSNSVNKNIITSNVGSNKTSIKLTDNNSSKINNSNINQSNKETIKNSSKVSISINNLSKKESYIHIPKIDDPLPDIEEEVSTEIPLPLMENSVVSEK